MNKYKYDQQKNIFINNEGKSLKYSDGSEEEKKLQEIVDSDIDLSTFSEDLPKEMNSWPTEYHFSRKRHLIIRQLNIKKNDTVLELGSGCGSITRYLAEIGAIVTSVEGTEARASVNGKRCKDFPNVEIYVDDINTFEIEKKFDWVLMIGVLEYSPKYSKYVNPSMEYLETVQKYLKEDGKFILAIENKLGIKYFNGATEDHNGRPFYGPEDLYAKKDITTWGKNELHLKLSESGFNSVKFMSTFPDYKLPTLLINECADNVVGFRTEELTHYLKSHDYTGNDRRFFEESFFISSLRKNKLLSNFANSFVVVCEKNQNNEQENTLAHYYSIGRKKQFCTQTIFKIVDDEISVHKNSLFPSDTKSQFECNLFDNKKVMFEQVVLENSKYLDGALIGFEFSKSVKRLNLDDIQECLRLWIKHLKSNFNFYLRENGRKLNANEFNGSKLKDILIDGNAVDCGMHNIVSGVNGTNHFDLEWQASEPVPLNWVLCRNINVSLRESFKIMQNVDKSSLLAYIAIQFQLTTDNQDYLEAMEIESRFGLNITERERIDFLPLSPMFK